MKPRYVTRRRAAPGRLAGVTAIVAAFALALLPVAAGAQGGEQYEPSPPPTAGGDPPSSASGSGGGTFGSAPQPDSGSAATDTSSDTEPSSDSTTRDTVTGSGAVADSGAVTGSGAVEQLPVTGLPALPVAVAGLVMLLLGSLGLRRFSDKPASKDSDPDDPSGTRRILGR